MTTAPETTQSFVLLGLGERRFALAASQVAELVAPSRIFHFPHKSPALEGVILRRGRMLPVCDIAERLIGKKLAARRFFLLATRKFGAQPGSGFVLTNPESKPNSGFVLTNPESKLDWIAIPVSGDCELINTEMMEAGSNDSPHVEGWLSHAGEVIEVLRLSALTPGPAEHILPAAPLSSPRPENVSVRGSGFVLTNPESKPGSGFVLTNPESKPGSGFVLTNPELKGVRP